MLHGIMSGVIALTMADTDLELGEGKEGGGGGFVLLDLSAFPSSVIYSCFLPKTRRGAGPLVPSQVKRSLLDPSGCHR